MKRIALILLLAFAPTAFAAYVDATFAQGGSGTDSVTIDVPDHTDGDVIGCLIETDQETVSWGFTPVASGRFETTGGAGRASTFDWATKIASSEPGTYTHSIGGGNGLTRKAVCFSLTGRDSATPSASQVTNDAGGSASPISTPLAGVTAAAGDDIVILTGDAATTVSTSPITYTAPDGYTKRAEQAIVGVNFSSGGVAVATRDNVSAGATGTLTGSWAQGSGHGDTAGVVLAFSAAEGGDPDPEPVVATKLIFGSQPGNITVGQTFGAFTVRAVDDDDALDESFDGDVTLALETGKGELEGTLTEAAVAGIATFDDVHIDTLNVDAVIQATADGLTAANSDEFDVTAGTGTGTSGFPSSSRLGGLIQ